MPPAVSTLSRSARASRAISLETANGSGRVAERVIVRKSGKRRMIRRVYRLLDKADAVVTYFGNSFDLPVLLKEFVTLGLNPPTPYKKLDLCKTVQTNFRFASSKLDFVCKALGLAGKVRHTGFELWVRCMANDPKSWRLMERYNRQDVTILEALYDRLKPWITSHPNHGAFDDRSCCPACGSEAVQRRGVQVAQIMRYPRYSCTACGHWFRGTKSLPAERPGRNVRPARIGLPQNADLVLFASRKVDLVIDFDDLFNLFR